MASVEDAFWQVDFLAEGDFDYKDEGEEHDYRGIHCGEVFEVCLNDVWVPARMEMAGDWYLMELPGLKLNGLMVRQRAG